MDINSDEKFWASDFQIHNPKYDPNVRKALQARYADKSRSRKEENNHNWKEIQNR